MKCRQPFSTSNPRYKAKQLSFLLTLNCKFFAYWLTLSVAGTQTFLFSKARSNRLEQGKTISREDLFSLERWRHQPSEDRSRRIEKRSHNSYSLKFSTSITPNNRPHKQKEWTAGWMVRLFAREFYGSLEGQLKNNRTIDANWRKGATPKGAENYNDFSRRVQTALKQTLKENELVLIVAHRAFFFPDSWNAPIGFNWRYFKCNSPFSKTTNQ